MKSSTRELAMFMGTSGESKETQKKLNWIGFETLFALDKGVGSSGGTQVLGLQRKGCAGRSGGTKSLASDRPAPR